jgi:hypothetical protein
VARAWQTRALPAIAAAASLASLATALALGGCGSHTVHYQNSLDPTLGQAQFDRDKYDCELNSERPPATEAERSTASVAVIDQTQVQSCLVGLGWHQVEK